MKKDLYAIVSVVALAIALSIIGAWWYQGAQNSDSGTHSNPSETTALQVKTDDNPSLGPAAARVQLIEFLDPECEACRAMHPIVKKVLKDYEGKIFYQIRYMPFHKNSAHSAAMLEATRLQNKYWESLDILMERQPEWADHHHPKPELIPGILKEIGIDTVQLEKDAQNLEIKNRIQRDYQEGLSIGVRATPTFFINGVELERLGEASLREAIDQAL